MAKHWVLVGLMGSGKSTVGALLAQRSGREFVDNDDQLLAATGRTAAQLQEERGRAALHQLEREALRAALRGAEPAVICGAASVVDDPASRALLHEVATVIWLDVDVDDLARRVRRQTHRPLGDDPRPQLEEQRRLRVASLHDVAAHVVSAEGPPDEIVDRLMTQLQP